MTDLAFHQFNCRSDNYGLLLHDLKTGATCAIDTPDAAEIERQLGAKGWELTHIFTTHHHGDHVEGNLALRKRYGCSITGPRAEGRMTCPVTIAAELAANPFLRTKSAEVRSNLGMDAATDLEVFVELRERKNSFR